MTVSSPCYLAVAVNCELINVKVALGAAELLFLAVHSHAVGDLTPKILNLLLLGAAFCCCFWQHCFLLPSGFARNLLVVHIKTLRALIVWELLLIHGKPQRALSVACISPRVIQIAV